MTRILTPILAGASGRCRQNDGAAASAGQRGYAWGQCALDLECVDEAQAREGRASATRRGLISVHAPEDAAARRAGTLAEVCQKLR